MFKKEAVYGSTILVVDDSEVNRVLLNAFLSKHYRVEQAASGAEAIAALSMNPGGVDLVLLDLLMPDVDGFAVLEHCRNTETLKTMPIIVVSSLQDPAGIRRAYELGATECLTRPMDCSIVERRVTMTLWAQKEHLGWQEQMYREKEYAKMAGALKFRSNVQARQMEIGPYASELFNVPQQLGIMDARWTRLFVEHDELVKVVEEVHSSSPENAMVHARVQLRVGDEVRWFQAVIKARWDSSAVPARYLGCSGVLIDVDELVEQTNLWETKATIDEKVGLLRGTFFKERVDQRISEEENSGRKYMFVFFDLDKFKDANDTWGHEFGDMVLARVGEIMRNTLRSGDLLCRWGGDEFGAFLEYTGDAHIVLDRLFKALCEDFRGFRISVSMGVALMGSDDASYDALYARADTALYQAKEAGRARYLIYDPEMGLKGDE